ncbi:MAG: Cytochrome C oxidase, cbb3-type, subunit III [Candidatus Kentron sp. G]|nr:MAG: Cytochrome C oxidase, cbb3-type, subunit III [Candidatus Kentron sp. G]VFM96517.1 MAG: Cytochrome C oxidase, cbb3-type, subunit III [Candidatus Kentron sp. G]VFM98648.1 MAG: Cytochrome C oxidase, cbb3-type, subunit III [Candidatus Kentron sp. G]
MQKMIVTALIAGVLAVAVYRVSMTDGRGEIVYRNHCGACHARGIAGAPTFGNEAEWAPRIAKGIDVLYASALNGLNGMPPKGGKTDAPDDDIKSAVDYMVSGSGG